MASTTNGDPVPNGSSDDNALKTRGGGSATAAHPARVGDSASDLSKGPNLVAPTLHQLSVLNASHNARYSSAGRSAPVSSTNSVVSSRETSPIRQSMRPFHSTSTSRSASRSRKGSQELSPIRGPGVISSNHSAFQRNSTIGDTPHLPPPSTDQTEDLPRKSNMAPPKPGDSPYQWPVSPRLRSPPPPTLSARNNLHSLNRSAQDGTVANMASKRQTIPSPEDSGHQPEGEEEDNQHRAAIRTLTRGTSGSTLETVQESKVLVRTPEAETEEDMPSRKTAGESGSDSGGTKVTKPQGEDKRRIASSNARPGDIISKRSFTSLSAARGKLAESSTRNMIVEAETVSSVPQVSLGGGAGGGAGRVDPGGSIRLKASDETIRPKKEKKRPNRKPTTLPAGTASSKADIFEAKVANAVDEADSSDSAETFVYESNPPDTHPTRQLRYHSRTPSATSMASQADQYGGRARPALREAGHSVTGKRSMKFKTNTFNTNFDSDGDQNSGRGSSRTNGHIHTSRHHHIGRHGRNGGHPSVLDQSPFTVGGQGAKSPRHNINSGNRHSSRTSQNNRTYGSTKNNMDIYGYDYDAEGADDERTPLVGSIRLNRSRHGRRPGSASLRQLEYLEQRRRGCFPRYALCIVLLLLVSVLLGGVTTFAIGVSKQLTNVYVKEIQNVLASEQEIMLDLDVHAINSNLFPLTINDMDVNIFAKSRYVGSDSFWRDHGPHPDPLPRIENSRRRAIMAREVRQPERNSTSPSSTPDRVHVTGGVDKGTDPIEDPTGDPQTMLLGRIFHFYSPLIFESSPWKHESAHSKGEVRLVKPGNKTEEGGTERWERVLQHPFELIVRGVLKYQLPLSSRTRSASISSSIRINPDDTPSEDGEGDGVDDKQPDDGSDDSVHIN